VLLSRPDITTIISCLPILVQLSVVKKFLLAGKHVQSEKPIAGDISTASDFINWFRASQTEGAIPRSLIWAVAEEFRLLPSISYMASSVSALGDIQTFHAFGYGLMRED
jgi:predicted dehydrogenase